jgi:hypothetical protein
MRAKTEGRPLHEVVDEVVERGLCSLDEARAREQFELDFFLHLLESAPEELDAQQRRILRRTYELGLWRYPRMTLGDVEEGRVDLLPYLDVAALAKSWRDILGGIEGEVTEGRTSPVATPRRKGSHALAATPKCES